MFERSASNDKQDRRLGRADFLRLFEDTTRISVPQSSLEDLLNSLVPSGGSPALAQVSALAPVTAPLIDELADRRELLDAVAARLAADGLAWLSGSSGHGKSSLAIRTARDLGGAWGVLRLRGRGSIETTGLLRRAAGEALLQRLEGVVLDDLEEIQDRDVGTSLGELRSALARAGAKVVATSARRPTVTLLRQCGARPEALIEVRRLSEEDVRQVVERLGGDPAVWGRYVRFAGRAGHPQLVHALAVSLSAKGWPAAEFRTLDAVLGRDEAMEEVQEDTRQRLVGELPDPSRDHLYRLVALLAPYDRQAAMAVARVEPAVERAGEAFGRLVGPWIERVGEDLYRTSPLLGGSDALMLRPEELTAVHAAAARDLVGRRTLNVDRVEALFMHALIGREPQALARVALAVLGAKAENLPMLAEASTGLRRYTTISGQFPEPSPLHPLLRAAQIVLLATSREGPQLREALEAFEQEMLAAPAALDDGAPTGDHLRLLIWGRILQIDGLIEVIDDLPGACLNLGELARRLGMKVGPLASAAGVVIENVTIEVFLFYHQLCHAETVMSLIRTFEALKRRSADERASLLGPMEVDPLSPTLAVRNPWIRGVGKGQKGTPELAAEYRRLAALLEHPTR